MKKSGEFLQVAALVAGAWLCIFRGSAVQAAVAGAVGRCLTVVVPALYAMMIVSGMISRSGVLGVISRFLELPARLLFGMSGSELAIFLFSMVAGYPVGTRLICAEFSANRMTQRRAEILSGLAFGAGPAFINGCIASQIYGTKIVGHLIFVSAALANLLLAVVLSPLLRRSHMPNYLPKSGICSFSLTDSVTSAGRAMADICFAVIAFSVIGAALEEFGISGAISAVISAIFGISQSDAASIISTFLDVTSVSSFSCGNYAILPVICGLVSFGGICVMMQLSAVTSGKIALFPIIALRTAAGILSGAICKLLMPFFLAGEVVSASTVQLHSHRENSAVPSILLMLMTFMLMKNMHTDELRKH